MILTLIITIIIALFAGHAASILYLIDIRKRLNRTEENLNKIWEKYDLMKV